ncbi:TTK protein kinase [Aureococcus anophagefferens]|uniref:TTK protein kinase n=1 Tax=Aureococcus anophagefferens TaxID=44056 RepID=A0ABR1G8B3_AURAN
MTEVDKENVRTATPGAVKPAATKRATRASTRNARGVLRWGETLETLFLLDDAAHPERRALADRVVARPDDPNAWWQLLSDVAESGKRDARCRLFRRATQSIPKNRPELYEAEAYVSIWLGFVKAQTGLGQRQDALDALQYMRNEGIGKRSRAFYETWALCEAGAGKAAAAKEALQAGIRALPARERKSVVALAACSDAELAAQAAARARARAAAGPEDDATGVISRARRRRRAPGRRRHGRGRGHGRPAAARVRRRRHAGPGPERERDGRDDRRRRALKSSKAPMKREDIDYMLKWKPSKGGRSASRPRRAACPSRRRPRSSARAAPRRGQVRGEGADAADHRGGRRAEHGELPVRHAVERRDGLEPLAPKSSDEDSDAEDLPSRSTASTHSTSGGPARTPGESTATLEVEGQCYAKLALVGRGGSSKVFRVLGADGRVLALKRIKLRGSEVDHVRGLAGYANEVALLQRLRGKENIVTLYAADVDRAAGSIHMVMEAGDADLATVLSQRRTRRARAARRRRARGDDGNFVRLTWQQMLEAVHTIHEERIVHGDLKPANFLFIGTLNYMSPEAIRDSGAGPRLGRAPPRKPAMRAWPRHQQSKLQAVETSTSAKYMRDAPADDDEDGDGLLSVMSRGFARMQPVKEDAGEDMDTSHTASWTTH